jgi:flagellar biosynthesis protein FliP
MIENITLGQVAAFVAFVVALYIGIKTLRKELKEAITEMLKDQFKSVDEKLDSDNKRIKDLEDANKFMYKAISLLLQDDLAILEHLRTNNSTGKMAEQEKKVQEFLIER